MIAANASLREGSPKGRLVALTFDDGPGPYTAAVVSALRQLKAPATFFEVGEMIPAYRTLVANMARWGFVIGDHTWSHPQLTLLPSAKVIRQIASTRNLITKITRKPVQFMRPPYGAQSARIRTLAGRLGLVTTLWSIDTTDWTRPGVTVIVARALAARAGEIVVMHDGGGNRSQTVAAVPTIVRALRARGFRLVTLPQLLALAPPARLRP
jgi:peptidoglycan/xylan/chitin deacetylase (PgdA/CDA1 family)